MPPTAQAYYSFSKERNKNRPAQSNSGPGRNAHSSALILPEHDANKKEEIRLQKRFGKCSPGAPPPIGRRSEKLITAETQRSQRGEDEDRGFRIEDGGWKMH
jgi:hypothetical protein